VSDRGAQLRAVLEAARADTFQQIAALDADFATIVDASAQVATDDEHDPEGATIAFERQQVDAIRTQALRRLGGLDRALDQLVAGTYGECESCGQPISAERLAVRPAARTCIGCAS
jgi:DnaK suppressor protein